MALTWWCAHKLTWDCTTIDDSAEASGRGLLETAGIDRSTDEPADNPPPTAPAANAAAPPANLPPASQLSQKKWQQLLDRPRRPHTPGVWIVYFSLASLPIFGLGQLFIPAARTASRRYVFLLLCVYVGCGLALLLTTSFLSLRRYLRGRRLEMPAAMAGNWLVIGGVMVVGLLLFSALLPRPAPEYAISALPDQIGSADHTASPISAGSEGVRDRQAGPDSGVDHSAQQPSDQPPDQPAGADTRQTSTGPGGQVAGKSGSPASKGETNSAGKSSQQPDAKPQAPSPGSQSPGSQSSEKPAGNPPAGGEKGQNPPSDAQAQKETAQQQAAQTQPPPQPQNPPPAADRMASPPPPAAGNPPPAAQKPPGAGQQPATPPPSASSPPPAPPPPPLPSPVSLFDSLAGMFKLAFYAVLICGVAYGAWRFRAELIEIVAGWLAALRAFWRSFFVDPDAPRPTAEEIAFGQQQLGWSFSDFVDPFASGVAVQSSPAELVKYTFAALEAWGRDQGHSRGPDETPHEFVALLGSKIPRLRADSLALANLYSRAVYSQASLSPAATEQSRAALAADASDPRRATSDARLNGRLAVRHYLWACRSTIAVGSSTYENAPISAPCSTV